MNYNDAISEEIIVLREQMSTLAFRLTGNTEEANDLTQDTLLKALEKSCGFRQEAAVKTWLTKIMINTFLSQKKKFRDHVSLEVERLPAPDWSANPEKIVVKRELQWCIQHTLDHHITQRYAVALTLRELHGLRYKEIADVLGVELGTAKVLVHRSRQAFRRHLEQSGCYFYVRDYSCICDGVRDGLSPIKELRNR
jgi:RNA polymerase sigma-70 factor (ECF subfamily)